MKNLPSLFRELLYLRKYRSEHARSGIPWWMRIAYYRNRIRHRALENWQGGYVYRTDGCLVAVPAVVDSSAGHRLFKPSIRFGLIDTICRAGDIILDIGANVGEYTLQFAQITGPTGRVVAFEPVPHLAANVAKTSRVNRQTWVEVQQLALSATDGTADFSVEGANSGGSRLGAMSGDFTRISVRTMRLDSFLAARPDIARIDLIKLDVEGFEDQVLIGARDTLSRFRPNVLVETGFESSAQRQTIHDLFTGLQYDLVGIEVPGGIAEATWSDYLHVSRIVAEIKLSNMLLMPKVVDA